MLLSGPSILNHRPHLCVLHEAWFSIMQSHQTATSSNDNSKSQQLYHTTIFATSQFNPITISPWYDLQCFQCKLVSLGRFSWEKPSLHTDSLKTHNQNRKRWHPMLLPGIFGATLFKLHPVRPTYSCRCLFFLLDDPHTLRKIKSISGKMPFTQKLRTHRVHHDSYVPMSSCEILTR